MTKFQTYVLNASVAASTNSTRLGQELMEALPVALYEKYAGGEYDCFYKESLVGKFLNAVYADFQVCTEVVVWSREPRWYQRQVVIDCSIEDTAGMTSAEFEDHIVDWIDVLDVQGADDEPNYALEEIEEVGDWTLEDIAASALTNTDWATEAKLRAAERSDLRGVNDYY
ncbi:MAG: hypothetical protein HOM84_04470 [Thiotrichales bacterium]|jgi:hypothetical protein|nr:hypothetical protein [Thiotrichales bacterium]